MVHKTNVISEHIQYLIAINLRADTLKGLRADTQVCPYKPRVFRCCRGESACSSSAVGANLRVRPPFKLMAVIQSLWRE